MRMPKRGERGFTLIELLIVVAILGVLAAVVIPNVQRFMGAGTEEAKDTELANIQTAVSAMMVDNGIATIPCPVDGVATVEGVGGYDGKATNDMRLFPDANSSTTFPAEKPGKKTDPDGKLYVATPEDGAGYVLYGHDIHGGDGVPSAENPDAAALVNYVAMEESTYLYTVDASGTVHQGAAAPK